MDPPARHYIRIILRSDTTNDGMEYTHIYIHTYKRISWVYLTKF